MGGCIAQTTTEGLRIDPVTRHLEPHLDDLARAFVAVAFGGDEDTGAPPRERLKRFQMPMTIGIEGEAAAEYRPWVARHATHLAFLTGQPIRLARPGDTTNVLVILSPDPARFIAATRWREILGRAFGSQALDDVLAQLRPEGMGYLVVGGAQQAPEHIRLAIIAINTTFQAPTVWAAIVEELSQALGLLGDPPEIRNTIFSDINPHMDLTEPDRWLLRVLYHPAVQPGMTRQQAQRAAMSALSQLGYAPGREIPAGDQATGAAAIYAPSAATVARNFLRIAFADEGETPGNQRRLLARWDGGVRIALAHDAGMPSYHRWVETHVAQLAHVTRQRIELGAPDAADFLVAVTFDAPALLRQTELRTMLVRGFDDPEIVARRAGEFSATRPCFRLTSFHDNARTRPRAAVLVVSAHADPPMIWACIVQETAQALGMFGRDDALAWTAFNTQLQHVDLTGQDLAFLRLLYRPALQPGMPREAVAAAICGAVRGCA